MISDLFRRLQSTCRVSRSSLLLWILAPAAVVSLPVKAYAPSSVEWRRASLKSPGIDPGLVRWLDSLKDKGPGIRAGLDHYLGKAVDPLDRQFLHLYTSKVGSKRKEAAEQLARTQQDLKSQPDHPLRAYVYEQLGRVHTDAVVEKQWAKEQEWTCPLQRRIKSDLADPKFVRSQSSQVKRYLELASRGSHSYQKQILRSALKALKPNSVIPYRASLQWLMEGHDDLKVEFPWVFQDSQGRKHIDSYQKLLVADLASRRRCTQARNMLVGLVKRYKKKSEKLPVLMSLSTDVDRCFGRFGSKKRITFWKYMGKRLQKSFGSEALALVRLEIAKIYWNQDRYKTAYKYTRLAYEIGERLKMDSVKAKARYLRARIRNNDQRYQSALADFEEVVRAYPDLIDREEALRSMVVISVGLDKWSQVQKYASRLVVEEEARRFDDRSGAHLGFGLFWLGRALMELGSEEDAKLIWKRLAAEYHSTYYGAIAHRLAEIASREYFSLKPQAHRPFEENEVMQVFSPANGPAVERIYRLLRFGLKKDASCEIGNLEVNPDNPDQVYAQALLYHAAGDWLDGIKSYLTLPRSYRRHLPLGSELIVFPRKYEKLIEKYSHRIGMDPDLIISLVRQESVFNPSAMSGAGARGLMQLMRRTAYSEARRLPKSYVPTKERRRLMSLTKRSKNLFKPEPNVILGVHYIHRMLKRYSSTPLALAAYNAGPTVVAKWMKRFPTDDLLYFIEVIPYKETRDYVKLIMRNYFYYKKWYRSPRLALPHMNDLFSDMPSTIAKRIAL